MKNKFLKFISASIAGVMLLSSTAFAAEPANSTLTIEEAANKAFKNSNKLKKIGEDYEVAVNNETKIKNSLSEAETDTAVIAAAIALMQNELTTSMTQYTEKDQKTSIELTLYKYFSSVLAAERELELYDKRLELDKKDLDIQKVKCELGLISQSAYDLEEVEYEKSLLNREAKEQAISEAYRSLNTVMGTQPDTRYVLVAEFDYEELTVNSLESYISDAVKSNNIVKETERSIEIDEYEHRITYYTSGAEEDNAAIAINQKKRSVTEKKDSIRATLQEYYDSIISLELSHKTAVADYEAMLKQLEIKEVQFELGKITALEIEEYKYKIDAAYDNILKLEANHEVLVKQFKNPQTI